MICGIEGGRAGAASFSGSLLGPLLGLLVVLCTGCSVFRFGRGEQALELVFHGNREIGHSDLVNAIAPVIEGFESTRYKKSTVDDAAYELERFYKGEGFAFSRVDYSYEEPADAKPRAVFEIEEGPRTELVEIQLAGNTAFDIATLARFFATPRKSFFQRHRTWYVAGRVSGDAEEIERWYYGHGYLDVEVRPPSVEFNADRTEAVITVWIKEGIQYRLKQVEIESDGTLPPQELEALYRPYIGAPFLERIALEIQGRIQEYYADRGYPDTAVERLERAPPVEAGQGAVELAFRVSVGTRVTISAIEIDGAPSTRKSFLLSRMELEPGDVYSRKKERASFRRLYQTGLFERVHVGLSDAEGESRPLEVDLVEASSLEVFLQPGYGSYERGRVSAGVREKNLFGTGRILRGEGSLSNLAQSGRIGLTDPWFFGSDVSANLSVFGNRREEPSFTSIELGSGIEFTRRFTRRFHASVGYQFRRSDALDVEVLDPETLAALEDVSISSILLSPTWDSRDNVIEPTDGSLTKLIFEFASEAIGSEINFLRVNATQSTFFDLDDDTALGASLRFGIIDPLGNTDSIPLQERFFNGGESTVRSYEEDELGPKDVDGNPVGGEAFSVFSIELRRRVWGRLGAAVFYDIGHVAPEANDLWDYRDYGQAVGLGVRYATPVGPVRLDGAINPDPEDDEASGALHFSVGLAF